MKELQLIQDFKDGKISQKELNLKIREINNRGDFCQASCEDLKN